MAVKTFTTNELLTSSDTNTYLANSGLVYITQGTFTSATCAIDNCLTSTFTNYRIIIGFENVTAIGTYLFRLRSGGTATTTDYYFGGWVNYTNAASGNYQSGASAATSFPLSIHTSGSVKIMTVLDLGSPQLGERTSIQNKSICSYSNYISLDTAGFLNNTTQYDGFQITQDSGGTIDATMTVYGYRKP